MARKEMAPVLDASELRKWEGRVETVYDEVGADLVRKFLATFDLPDSDLERGSAVPRLLHWCLAQPAAPSAMLGEDGHPARGGFLPPVPLPRRMWAGSRIVFHGNLRIGDVVRRVSRIADVSVKEGRSGSLCFVTVEHAFDVAGHVAVTEEQDIVYREAATTASAGNASSVPAPEGTVREGFDPSPPLLFRYSALTFNCHRIHYDFPYTTSVEGYPGLVVHGPLQATLLYNLAHRMKGAAADRFSFRGQSPLFSGEKCFLHARTETGDAVALWTAHLGGPAAMLAEARWS